MSNSNEEIEISIPDLFHSIWDLRWVILLLTVLGAIAGGALSWDDSPSYETRASMIVNARTSENTYRNGSKVPGNEDIQLAQNLMKTVQLLACSDRVLGQVLDGGGYGEAEMEELKDRITVTGEEGTSFLWLTLSWEEPQQAAALLDRIMEVLPDVMREVLDIGSVNVIDTARQAEGVSTASLKGTVTGMVAGLLLGCLTGAAYYLFVPKVRGDSALEALGLDVIGQIPDLHFKKNTMAGYLDGEGLPERYRVAYGRFTAVFRFLAEKENRQIFAVTSCAPGEGKSTVAYNLALCLTELGCKVLLLDFDFKKGVLYQLAKRRKPADGDVRSIPRTGDNLNQLLEQMDNGIYTIQGFSQKNIFEADNRIFPAIREMRGTFDYILIDTPPVGILSDVQQMRGLMDGVLLVVRQDQVSRLVVEESLEFLEKAGIPVAGSILNGKDKAFYSAVKHNFN